MIRRFDVDSWMWGEAVAALERAERHHRRFFALLVGPSSEPVWEPPIDMFETDDGLRILVALPGIRADQVSVHVDATGLLIRTERVPPPSRDCRHIRRMEIPYGRFERHIELPAGGYALHEQRMADGCLELHFRRE